MGKLRLFEIVLDNGKSVYSPSEFVNGKCIIVLDEDIKLKKLKMTMTGVANVSWTESKSTDNGSESESYTARKEYFKEKSVLFGYDTGDANMVLNCGRHEFNFSFQLPSEGIPTSFEGSDGNIRYLLEVVMKIPWSFNHTAKKAFTVICPVDINKAEYLAPVENSREKEFCCLCISSKLISLHAYTERRGYCSGESINLSADIENMSNRIIIPKATLFQEQTFHATTKSRSSRKKYTVVEGDAIQPFQSTRWDSQLFIPVITPSINDCSIINVDYIVQVTLNIPMAVDLRMELPVIIGTVPLQTTSSNYRHINQVPSNIQDKIPSAPNYSEFDISSLSSMAPPAYTDCVGGSINLPDENDDLKKNYGSLKCSYR